MHSTCFVAYFWCNCCCCRSQIDWSIAIHCVWMLQMINDSIGKQLSYTWILMTTNRQFTHTHTHTEINVCDGIYSHFARPECTVVFIWRRVRSLDSSHAKHKWTPRCSNWFSLVFSLSLSLFCNTSKHYRC